jgi:hypothetical protein
MYQRSDDDSTHPALWHKIAELRLQTHGGCVEDAAQQAQQALAMLHLPARLLPKLQTSVYNAVTRVCAAQVGSAQTGGEVRLHLFVAAQSLTGDGLAPGSLKEQPHDQSGWGFFLIERRTGGLVGGSYLVELYCYQEGHEPR